MDSTLEQVSERKITKIYSGPTDRGSFSRSIAACEGRWKNEDQRIPSFDELIVGRLEQAKTEGRTAVQIVDIGSGDAEIFHDFLDNPAACTETKKFLQDNPNMSIRMVGLTDAQGEREFNTSVPIPPSDPDNPLSKQVQVENRMYTLTRTQTLDNFLKLNNLQEVDTFLATVSLTYMGPETFRQVVNDAIQHLRSGGRLIATSYADLPPGYSLDNNTFMDLNVPESDKGESSLGKTISESGIGVTNQYRDPEEEERNLDRAIALFKKLGVLSDEEIVEAKTQAEASELPKPQQLMRIARDTLIIGKHRLLEKKLAQVKKIKTDILDQLKGTYSPVADISVGKQTIYIEKN